MGFVDDPVENGVGHGGVCYEVMPFRHGGFAVMMVDFRR